MAVSLVPRREAGYIRLMTKKSTRTIPDYTLAVYVVPSTGNETEQCPWCQNATCAAIVSYTRHEPGDETERIAQDLCTTCVLPFVDQIDWLNTDVEVDVEVSRSVTARPF